MPRSSPAPSSRAPAAKETTVIVIRKRRVDPAEEGPRRAGLPAWRLAPHCGPPPAAARAPAAGAARRGPRGRPRPAGVLPPGRATDGRPPPLSKEE